MKALAAMLYYGLVGAIFVLLLVQMYLVTGLRSDIAERERTARGEVLEVEQTIGGRVYRSQVERKPGQSADELVDELMNNLYRAIEKGEKQ